MSKFAVNKTGEALRLTREQKQSFLERKTALPVLLFIAALSAYAGSLLAALAASSLSLSLAASAVCGLTIVLLFIIGHDACHQSFTPSRLANHLIGRMAFLPSLHPYSLWDLGHNRTHHRYNNIRGKDYVWEPMSPDDYRSAPFRAKLAYRFFRSPIGIPFYYGCAIWAKRMAFIVPWRMADGRASYSWDLLTVWLFFALQAFSIVSLGAMFGKGPLLSLILGFAVPFAVWNALMSLAIYLHHMHPDTRWYHSVEAWRSDHGRLSGTVYVRFPKGVQKLLLHIMEHGAHHYAPTVPLYNLVPLQKIVADHGGSTWDWSLREFLRISRECKLFDYESGKWRRFEPSPREA